MSTGVSDQRNVRFNRWEAVRFVVDRRVRNDPYPFFAQLRSAEPVHTSVAGATLISSYELVTDVLRDPRFSSYEPNADLAYRAGRQGAGVVVEAPFRFLMNRGGSLAVEVDDPFVAMAAKFLIALDPPDHTRLRKLVSRSFTPRVVADSMPLIAEVAHELIDGFEADGSTDLVTSFNYHLPVAVICKIVGVPAADFDRFHSWIDDFVARLDVDSLGSKKVAHRATASAIAISDYLLSLAADRRAHPQNDLLSTLVEIADDGDRLSEDELVSVVGLLLAAGHETTANLIGNSVWHLHRNRGQLHSWKSDPSVRRNGVEELLRFDSPVQMVQRIALEDLEIGGVHIPKGRLVIPILAAANRDPERFDDPDRLDLGRPQCQPMSFGFGIHHCIGAALARAEGEIGLGILYDRLPNLRPASAEPAWRSSVIFRGLKSLRVRWD